MMVRPFGRGGRWAGTQSDGNAASTAALNMALSSTSAVILQINPSPLKWPLPLHRRLQEGKRTHYRKQKICRTNRAIGTGLAPGLLHRPFIRLSDLRRIEFGLVCSTS